MKTPKTLLVKLNLSKIAQQKHSKFTLFLYSAIVTNRMRHSLFLKQNIYPHRLQVLNPLATNQHICAFRARFWHAADVKSHKRLSRSGNSCLDAVNLCKSISNLVTL